MATSTTYKMTDLDKELQEIASRDWPKLVKMIGEDGIIVAKVCLLRQRDKSYKQISNRLGISEKQARSRCYSCDIPE